MSIDQIKASFKELPLKDREKLLVELQRMEAKESDVHFSRREWLNNKLGCCPHCQSNKYRKHGIDKGCQRYMCNSCQRSFTEYTGTWMDGLHKKELVSEYIKLPALFLEHCSKREQVKQALVLWCFGHIQPSNGAFTNTLR